MWAMTWDFQRSMCDQQSLRSACAYAQSDQSLCLSLDYSMSVKLLTEHHLEFLSLKGDCIGSPESTLVKMPHCWKSHVAAQLCSGYSKDPQSQWDGSFEHPKQMFKVMDKKIFSILRLKNLLTWAYGWSTILHATESSFLVRRPMWTSY